jgi:hypothetical protein
MFNLEPSTRNRSCLPRPSRGVELSRKTSNTICFAGQCCWLACSSCSIYPRHSMLCSYVSRWVLLLGHITIYSSESSEAFCRPASKLTAINFTVPSGPAQWDRVPGPDEEVRPLAFTPQAHVCTLQRRGLYHALADRSRRPAGRHTRSNYLTMRYVTGLLVQTALHVICEGGRYASDRTTMAVGASLHDIPPFSPSTSMFGF